MMDASTNTIVGEPEREKVLQSQPRREGRGQQGDPRHARRGERSLTPDTYLMHNTLVTLSA